MIQKLIIISFIFFSTLYSGQMENKVILFEKKRLSTNNTRMTIQNINIIYKQEMPIKGWYAYIVDIQVKLNDNIARVKDIVFTDGNLVATDLLDINTGESLKNIVSPKLKGIFYNKEHLIAGSNNAKEKVVIFSDLLCSTCKIKVPEIIKYVNDNASKIGLYYYHYPLLKYHPVSNILSKLVIIASQNGKKNIELAVYDISFKEYFDVREKDKRVILETFNKIFKTNITLKQLENEDIEERLLSDMVMGNGIMVNSTPTIYVNGIKDKTQQKYKTLGK